MRRKLFLGLLALEAICCIFICVLKIPLANVFPAAMALPFEQIGMGLRGLSLSGWFGNIIAILIYILVSLSPVGALLLFRQKRRLNAEDWLLVLLSGLLFGVLYLMINPALITKVLGVAAQPPVGEALLGGGVYALITAYLILRILRLFVAGSIQKLERYMTILLGVLNVLFVFIAFGVCFSELRSSISLLREGNSGNAHLLGASYIFLALRYVVNAMPFVLDILVVFAALRLFDEMRKERYSAESIVAAKYMSRLCTIALAVTVLTNAVFNLLQLLFAKSLMSVHNSIQIPLMSILFVLAALLLTRFLIENKKLKDENDCFI